MSSLFQTGDFGGGYGAAQTSGFSSAQVGFMSIMYSIITFV
jgi:hypothetical protein